MTTSSCIALFIIAAVVLTSCDMNHREVTKIEQCAYECHVLYDSNTDTLINCMKKCDKKFLHIEQKD